MGPNCKLEENSTLPTLLVNEASLNTLKPSPST